MSRGHFNSTKIEFPGTSNERYVIGIVIGVLFWIVFYLFLNGCRESVRIIFSTTEGNYLWLLSKKEAWFFNFISSLLSASLGISICLKHWYEKPNLDIDPYFNYRRKGIINDISSLNTYTLSVLSKLMVVLAIWSGSLSLYVKHKIYPDANFIWILIVVVLFLEQWKTIRRVFRNRSKKPIIITAIISIIGSVLFAFWAPLNAKKVDKILVSNSIEHNYPYLPVNSSQTERIEKKSLVTDLYFLYPKGQKTDPKILPELFTRLDDYYLFDEIPKLVAIEREFIDVSDYDEQIFLIHADSGTPLVHIKRLHNELSKCGIKKIYYSTLPMDSYWPYSSGKYFGIRVQSNYFINKKLQNLKFSELENDNTILIKVNGPNSIDINYHDVNFSQLVKELKSYYYETDSWNIRIFYSDSITFQDYVKIRDQIMKVINKENE